MKNFLTTVGAVFFSATSLALAAPSLSSYSGTLSNGQVITLNGSGMGSGITRPRPRKWENLETGVIISTWNTEYTQTAFTIGSVPAEQRWSGSTYNIKENLTVSKRNMRFCDSNDITGAKWYTQYWIKLSTNWDWGCGMNPCSDGGCDTSAPCPTFLANVKISRFWSPGTTNENSVIAYGGYEVGPNGQLYCVTENTGDSTHYAMQNWNTTFELGKWHLLQFRFKENSALGVADGGMRMWFDGKLTYDHFDTITRNSSSELKRPFIIGFEEEWGDAGGSGDFAPNHFWMDDVVSDDKWTTFEISTCSTYAQGGCYREYQPLNSVTDTQSTFLFNAGSLATYPQGTTVYGWWTDENGTQNASGLSMTLGSGGSGGTTLAPSFSGVTTSSVTITWGNLTGNTYRTVFSNASDFSTVLASGVTGTNQNTTTYISLGAGTTVYFKVKISTEGDTSYGAAISTMVQKTRLNPTKTAQTASTIDWSFDNVGGINKVVVVDNDSDFSSPISSATQTGATYNSTNLASNTQHFIAVSVATEPWSTARDVTYASTDPAAVVAPAAIRKSKRHRTQ